MNLKPPFVTTAAETVKHLKEILYLLPQLEGKHAVDLGSGNGRIVIELARRGLFVEGFEEKESLIKISLQKIIDVNLTQNIHIFHKDYWQQNLSKYDIVYIYGIPAIMGKLEEKLQKELLPGSIVISNVYKFPHMRERQKIGTLYAYSMS